MSWKHRASRLLSRSRLSGRRGSRASKGAPGVDAVTIAEFESDLKNNLYKIWNRLSSGTCFPPPVRAVEIPKPHGGGTRIPGVPAVADRGAQTVVAGGIEAKAEQVFHPDSHGYPPGGPPPGAGGGAKGVGAGVVGARAEQFSPPFPHGPGRGRPALDAVAACRHRCWEND